MHFYKFINIILFFFLLEIIIHSSADDWKKLKKKLIALSILNGLRVKKSYVVPLPLPLPMPVIIKKASAPILLPAKKYPVFVPKPMPVYHLVPKFVPIHHKENVVLLQNPHEVKYHNQNHQYNQGWDQDWSQDGYSTSESMNQDMMYSGNDGHQEVAMPSFVHQNKYSFPLHDNIQDYQDQSSIQQHLSEEGMRRRNRKMFEKQDFRSFQDIGFNDYYNNEDLLMTSTELKTRKNSDRRPVTGVKQAKPDGKYRDLSADKNRKNRFSVRNKSIDGLPVSADQIKHILTDLKSINDEIERLPNGQLSTTDPPIRAGIKRIQVGEIRLRPQELRSLLSNNKLSFQ